MKSNTLILLFSICIFFLSCKEVDPNAKIEEGVITGQMYSSDEIGWTFQIPDKWKVISKDEMAGHIEKGLEAMEEVQEVNVDPGFKQLLNIEKDELNGFQSSIEPFKLEYEGEYEENNVALKDLIYNTYINQGMKIDTSSSTTTVDGLLFNGFHIKILSETGDIIIYQDMYSRFMNGYDFGANLMYNNDKDKAILENAWNNSKFKK